MSSTSAEDKLTFLAESMFNDFVSVEYIEIMRKQGVSISYQQKNTGDTILHYAAKYINNSSFIKYLVKYGALMHILNKDHELPMHCANNRNMELFAEICPNEIINAQRKDKFTFLHLAAQNKNRNAVKILLARGADPFIKDKYGNVPADYFADCPELDMPSKTLNDAMIYHCTNPTVVTVLLENGACINYKNSNGASLLAYLTQMSDVKPEFLTYLISKGVKIDIPSDNNSRTRSIIASAAEYNNETFISYCIGIAPIEDINYTSMFGNTALHYAARNQNNNIINMLIMHGANKTIKNMNGEIPYDYYSIEILKPEPVNESFVIVDPPATEQKNNEAKDISSIMKSLDAFSLDEKKDIVKYIVESFYKKNE